MTADCRSTRDGITVEISRDWYARPLERDIAPTGLGMCEICDLDIVPGHEISSVNDGRYAHYDCVPWDDEEGEDAPPGFTLAELSMTDEERAEFWRRAGQDEP